MNAAAGVPSLTLLQEDLLKAAFAADETAAAAWRRWRDAIDWEAHLDHDAFRLLPRTYRNLRRLGVADPLLPRLKGIARQAWYANQRRLRRFCPTVQALATAGVELLLVPPTAVLLHDATAVLDHQHAPLACAVRSERAEAAIRCLWREGWRTGVQVPHWSLGGYVLAAGGLMWRDADGQLLELLWQWDRSDRGGRFPGEVWERVGHGRLVKAPVLTLDPADAVHDVCRQPLAENAFSRISDLLLFVDATSVSPDWHRVFARAAQAPIAPGWRESFAALRVLLPHLIPASVVADWPAPQVPTEQSAATGGMRDRLAAHWTAYRQAFGEHHSLARALRQLPGYLLARWNLPALERIPPRLWRGLRYEWRAAHRSR